MCDTSKSERKKLNFIFKALFKTKLSQSEKNKQNSILLVNRKKRLLIYEDGRKSFKKDEEPKPKREVRTIYTARTHLGKFGGLLT